MKARRLLKRLYLRARATRLALSPDAKSFECPVCGWQGVFLTFCGRPHAQCPGCEALERHRLQKLVLDRLLPTLPCTAMRALHFAPEPLFEKLFVTTFARYETADIERAGVDHRVDLQALPFADASYDFVYASHVLEHVPDDHAAVREIRRILRPGGVAVLPVPLFTRQAHTIEYAEPNPNDSMHMRAPGMDYYDRYRQAFRQVEIFDSTQFPAGAQLFALGLARDGSVEATCDFVPVCHA